MIVKKRNLPREISTFFVNGQFTMLIFKIADNSQLLFFISMSLDNFQRCSKQLFVNTHFSMFICPTKRKLLLKKATCPPPVINVINWKLAMLKCQKSAEFSSAHKSSIKILEKKGNFHIFPIDSERETMICKMGAVSSTTEYQEHMKDR